MKHAVDIFERIRREFEERSGLNRVKFEVAQRASGPILVLYVSYPTERFFQIVEDIVTDIGDDAPLVTIKGSSEANLIDAPEGQLLLSALAETQNVNRYTFERDFFSRYTKSVSGAEVQIVASANHVVLGRRGAGKSMLLLYAWHSRKQEDRPSLWVDMQVYSGRDDIEVISDLISDLISQASEIRRESEQAQELLKSISQSISNIDGIRKLLPSVRRYFSYFANNNVNLFIFLDDFHVIGRELQPILLDAIYAISRGNKLFLKISAIETLTKTFDPASKQGIEVPQDAQNIKLDYNLTMPDKATSHIEAILNSHAQYAGVRSIRRLCVSPDVISRLTWVAAGVPRDALNLFAQAMSKASLEGRKRVSVSNVNIAASETLSFKLRDLDTDASQSATELKVILERVKEFVTEKRTNAFLLETGIDAGFYEKVMNLVHLRLLHVISEGITVGKAGRKYLGLILDYGFYTGIRAAQSVDLFNKQSHKVAYKELRALPIFVP